MLSVHAVLIIVVLIGPVPGTVGENNRHLDAQQNGRHHSSLRPGGLFPWLCTDRPDIIPFLNPCLTTSTESTTMSTSTKSNTTSTSTEYTSTSQLVDSSTTTVTMQNEPEVEDSSSSDSDEETSTGTPLEQAHWCRLNNNTFLPLDYTFIHKKCFKCQCTSSRLVRCRRIQCMPTYCFDESRPILAEGQCCTQCRYENANGTCEYNQMTFPHGLFPHSYAHAKVKSSF